ncbi:MAG TPA: Hpt domain-containing protein [Opitutaceae bacterium]|jgi:HPt (histidine-containing phosphotransfer) domain-containing protein|nr:Hpt domain-containing protein [Opitutaceae bacterium]
MILDPDAIDNIRSLAVDDAQGFLREIIGIFLTDTPSRINEMQHALESKDAPAYSRAAHSIKGSAANLGAVSMKAAAEKAEQLGKSGLDGAAEALAAMREEFTRTRAALEQLAAG